jgi:hypothetical protein
VVLAGEALGCAVAESDKKQANATTYRLQIFIHFCFKKFEN